VSTSFNKNIYLNIQLSIATYLLNLYKYYDQHYEINVPKQSIGTEFYELSEQEKLEESTNKNIVKNTIIYLNGIIQSTIVKICKNKSDIYFKNLYNLLILILLNTIYHIKFDNFKILFENLSKYIVDDNNKIKVHFFNKIKNNDYNYINEKIGYNIIHYLYYFTDRNTIEDNYIFKIFNNIIKLFNYDIIIKRNDFKVDDFCVFIYNKNIYYGKIIKIIEGYVIIDKNSLCNFLTNKQEIPLLYKLIKIKINIKNIISYDPDPTLFSLFDTSEIEVSTN
jgi:hypothetical protein